MTVDSSQKAFQVLKKLFSGDVEEVWILGLSSQLGIIKTELLSRGTLDACLLHPRDVIRFVCANNCAQYILAHNHPSGNTAPSKQDRTITKDLFKISQLVQVPMSDHLIIGKDQYYSFADNQYLLRWGKKNSSASLFLRT